MFSEVGESWMISMLFFAICIAFQDYRFHIVYKDFPNFCKHQSIAFD
ncbi:hypothetical protein OI25_7392 [Paraburkholderia fungorum]|uniref:Uncharacterized protein n=1 Tax=Paraburkholderia fungorum TaxID=134537 RepID=A0AAU8STA9_9BURK|nr:hypothetical protein OI25_7392 [Paraburkholderia fungorum]EIF28058.1 hypothetical protein BCh11DRAFT_07953 [Burkholderia sp. Ch1-1]PRZ42099.1 hypothetical protein BX589_1604 [Paraburkholderia fungorum]